jgi:hypothetical protein
VDERARACSPCARRSPEESSRLKQDIRRLRVESAQLSEALAKGAGRDDIWQDLRWGLRSALDHAPSVFRTQDVQQKAEAARAILDQLAPYYGPDAAPTEPATR